MDSHPFNGLPSLFLPPLCLSLSHTNSGEWHAGPRTKPLVEFESLPLGWRLAERRKGNEGAARPAKRLYDGVPVSPALSREA